MCMHHLKLDVSLKIISIKNRNLRLIYYTNNIMNKIGEYVMKSIQIPLRADCIKLKIESLQLLYTAFII